MATKVGFLHNTTASEFGEAISETDSATKYGVESTQTNQESGSTAELSVVDFDDQTALSAANGLDITAIKSGPLEDRHDNYRHPATFNDVNLGVARVSVKDHDESPAVAKSKHEYWAPNLYDVISTAEDIDIVHDGHSDGDKLMHVAVKSVPGLVGFKAAYVSGRNDSTRAWSLYVQATDPELTDYSPTDKIAMSPTMVTVPNLGTLLFYFALDGDVPTGYKNQIIKIRITKDQGATWENYGSFPINPHYGSVNMTGATLPYAYEEAAVLKAVYADGKILLGMILSGSETTTLPEDETINCSRILNLAVSEDLGKSWATVPHEFITTSLEGYIPDAAYLFGSNALANGIVNTCAANFGLGYDPSSGKFVVALHSTGWFNTASTEPITKWDNLAWLYMYYNESDDLMEWRSTKVRGKTYKLLDGYGTIVSDYATTIGVDYAVKDYNTPASAWATSDGILVQTSDVNGPAYFAGQAYGGTHLIYNKHLDPTLNRSVGTRVDLYSGSNKTGVGGCFGLGFCRQDDNDFYAVTVDTSNITSGTVDINLKKVTAGVETTLSSSIGVSWNEDTWGSLEIRFYSGADIAVFFNDNLELTATFPAVATNAIREGEIFLITNNHDDVRFDNLGLITDTSARTLPGVCLLNTPSASRPRVGSNIDITIDHLNQAWICCDVTNVCVDVDSTPAIQDYRSNGIAIQKFKLNRSVERVEGKFLATDIYTVVFNDNNDYEFDAGIHFSICEYGVWPSHYDNTPRMYFSRAVWHKGDPCWFVRRSDTTAELFGLVQRNKLANRTLNANFGSTYQAFVQGQSPQYTGWELSPGFTFTAGADESILKITQDGTGYFFQDYKHISIAPNTNAERSVPARYFDYVHRGVVAYAILKSPSDNADGSYRGVLELYVPKISTSLTGSLDDNFVNIRVTSKDNPDEYYIEEWNGVAPKSSNWNGVGSVLTPKFSPKTWHELLVMIVPSNVTGAGPEICAYVKPLTSTEWEVITEGTALTVPAVALGLNSTIKWGCFDGNVTSKNAQEYRFCGYSDTCLIDPTVDPIRGETAPSGGKIYTSKGVVAAIGGGNLITNDAWKITDISRRDYDKSNIFARPTAEWRSANDSASKSIVIDMGHELVYDTVVLVGVNCQTITVESNDTNVWTSPNNSATLDMTRYNHLQYEKYTGKDYIVKVIGLNVKNDSLIGYRFIAEDAALGSYRIRANMDQYIVYETDTVATIPASALARYLDILEHRIAVKFTSTFRDRYFRLTFNKGTSSYPTPEGYFKLGMFAAGEFDQLQWNPEYPEEKERLPSQDVIKLASGTTRIKKRNAKVLNRTLNFNAIETGAREFAEQLNAIHAHCMSTRPVFYVPDILEYSETGFTYTYDVVPCLTQPVLEEPTNEGMLSNMKFILSELL